MPTGRPSSYTEDLANEICERLGNAEPLAVICRDKHMPSDHAVRDWAKIRPELASAIADARARGADVLAYECLEIANNTHEGVETVVKADGTVEERRGDMLGHRKLQIDTRLKLLAKWDPKRYGERTQLAPTDVEGNDLQMAPIMFVPVEAKET